MTNGVPPACKKLADEINQLQEAIDNLQKTVFGPDGLDKNVIRQIAALSNQLARLQGELAQCLIANDTLPATFNGMTAFLAATPYGERRGGSVVSVPLKFSVPDHTDIRILS